MKVIVQFSGGKDSTACLLWATNSYKKENIIAVFCDTGWESPITLQYIDEVIKKTGVEFITLKGERDFIELAKYKKRFPSTKARFCTDFLKVRPFIDWLLDYKSDTIIVQGIRSQESAGRALMLPECTFFKYYFEPYNIKQISEGKKPKFQTYRKKEVKEFVKKYVADIFRPFFNSTANEVMTYIKDNGLKANPLYYIGFKRVGCFPCIMCCHSEIKLIMKHFPERIKEIEKLEVERGYVLFPPNKIPKRFMKNKSYPFITDIVEYLKDNDGQMFVGEGKSCMSVYNICE